MQPVSTRFRDELRHSHQLAVNVSVRSRAGTVLVESLPVTEGAVTLDRTDSVRGRVELSIGGAEWLPTRSTDPLAPYGNELWVERGVRYIDSSIERVPLGVYRIEEVQLDYDTEQVRLLGRDRMAQVVDERFTSPYAPARYARHVDVISALVLGVYPTVDVALPPVASVVGAPVFERERDAALRDLASAIGCEVYFDGVGRFVCDFVPVPVAIPSEAVWEVDASETGVLVGGQVAFSRDGVYNGVVVTGQDPTEAGVNVSAIVVDDRSTSPTRWGGDFGHVPRFYASSLITTSAQAEAAARGLLYDFLGLNRTTDATCVPNPALEPGDTVVVRWPTGTRELHLIEALTIPLSVSGTSQLRTRRAETITTSTSAETIARTLTGAER